VGELEAVDVIGLTAAVSASGCCVAHRVALSAQSVGLPCWNGQKSLGGLISLGGASERVLAFGGVLTWVNATIGSQPFVRVNFDTLGLAIIGRRPPFELLTTPGV
jgi:hypothetical protein